jgi:hypothetical protein
MKRVWGGCSTAVDDLLLCRSCVLWKANARHVSRHEQRRGLTLSAPFIIADRGCGAPSPEGVPVLMPAPPQRIT